MNGENSPKILVFRGGDEGKIFGDSVNSNQEADYTFQSFFIISDSILFKSLGDIVGSIYIFSNNVFV